MSATSNRSKFFDNAKFILIFLVVFGHIISPLKGKDDVLFTLYTAIFLFHMPAFILISGYFAKGYKKKGYLLKTVKKVLIPYLIFQIIYSFYYYLIGEEEKLAVDFLHPHWSLWFLLSLFSWNLLLYVFAKLGWKGLPIAILLGAAIGYVDQAGSYLSLSRTFVFFPYFLLGFLLNGNQLRKVIRFKYSRYFGLLIMIAVLIVFSIGFPKDAIPWLLGDTSYQYMEGMEWFDGLIRVLQYGLTLLVVFGFLALIPSTQYRLTKIGERTLYVYLFHGFIIKSLQVVIPDERLTYFSGNYLFLICLSFLICLGLGSYFIKKYTQPLVELKG